MVILGSIYDAFLASIRGYFTFPLRLAVNHESMIGKTLSATDDCHEGLLPIFFSLDEGTGCRSSKSYHIPSFGDYLIMYISFMSNNMRFFRALHHSKE